MDLALGARKVTARAIGRNMGHFLPKHAGGDTKKAVAKALSGLEGPETPT